MIDVRDELVAETKADGLVHFKMDADGRHVWVSHPCMARWSEDGVTAAMLPLYGQGWSVVSVTPLTVTPSIFCNPAHGGCGVHGFIRDGKWVIA